jgi:hypothetical protein
MTSQAAYVKHVFYKTSNAHVLQHQKASKKMIKSNNQLIRKTKKPKS